MLQLFPDPASLAAAGAELFARLAAEAIAERHRFSVALSGGSTPETMFALLADDPYHDTIEWAKLEIFWSDERAVAADDPLSNYGMAKRSLLDRVPIPNERVHRMPGERTPLVLVADEYAARLRRTLGAGKARTPRLDLVLLGMGDDGHTASLFPHSEALEDRHRLVAPNYVPKLDAHRLTFTPKLINAAANVLFLVAGPAKAEALQAVIEGPRDPEQYPAQLVQPESGRLWWYVDRAAAANLEHGGKDGARTAG